jgi:hypothetical protein
MSLLSGGTGRLFNTEKQRAQIRRRGTAVVIFPCVPCPCLVRERQYDPNCPTCEGTGRFYPPAQSYPTTLLAVRETSQLTYLEAGTWEAGLIHATLLPEEDLAEGDQVRFVDKKMTFREVLQKDLYERLRFSGGVELLLVTDLLRLYRTPQDYILSLPNTVQWQAGGEAPGFGQQYSVRYHAYADYLVQGDDPRMRISGRQVQSSEVVLRRLDRLTEGTTP